MTGTLVLIGTPIGNLDDLSPRAKEALASLDALACEDTRRTRKIYERFGLARPPAIFSCHEGNEERAAGHIAGLLRRGLRVGLVSDAGMPAISDPGFVAVRAALEGGFEVAAVPGPTAAATALVLSGLPATGHIFLGFPPRRAAARRRFLAADASSPHTLVLFESPRRLGATLADALAVLGDRRAAVCLELTKLHERAARGWLSELAARFAGQAPRGEATMVIAGNRRAFLRAAGEGGGDSPPPPRPGHNRARNRCGRAP